MISATVSSPLLKGTDFWRTDSFIQKDLFAVITTVSIRREEIMNSLIISADVIRNCFLKSNTINLIIKTVIIKPNQMKSLLITKKVISSHIFVTQLWQKIQFCGQVIDT